MKHRRTIAVVMVVAALTFPTTAAASDTPVDGDSNPHPHHVDTPAGCVLIDAVLFDAEPAGLHNAGMRSGPTRGLWHGGC
ncbi:MAG: hypothetical protein ACLGHX_12700 [Acidimicrobiia bacterium]